MCLHNAHSTLQTAANRSLVIERGCWIDTHRHVTRQHDEELRCTVIMQAHHDAERVLRGLALDRSLRPRPTTVTAVHPGLQQTLDAPLHKVPALPHLPLLLRLGGALFFREPDSCSRAL